MAEANIHTSDDGGELHVRLASMSFTEEELAPGDSSQDGRPVKDVTRPAQPWSVLEALEQCQAALPDKAMAERYGISKDLIEQIGGVVWAGPHHVVSEMRQFELLMAAREALPAAWKEHGGVPPDLAARVDGAITAESERLAESVLTVAANGGLQLQQEAVASTLRNGSPDGLFTGKVMAVDEGLGVVVQSLGRGAGTVHRWDAGTPFPKIGEVLGIQVKGGRGAPAPAEKALDRGRSR